MKLLLFFDVLFFFLVFYLFFYFDLILRFFILQSVLCYLIIYVDNYINKFQIMFLLELQIYLDEI